jgi:hypothetical protein
VFERNQKNLSHREYESVYAFYYSEKRLIESCIKLGADDFIVKPAGLTALTSKLKQLSGRTAMHTSEIILSYR